MSYMLEIQNIHKTFNAGTINEKVALNGVNLNLNPGDFVTIIGGNGAGKSTCVSYLPQTSAAKMLPFYTHSTYGLHIWFCYLWLSCKAPQVDSLHIAALYIMI